MEFTGNRLDVDAALGDDQHVGLEGSDAPQERMRSNHCRRAPRELNRGKEQPGDAVDREYVGHLIWRVDPDPGCSSFALSLTGLAVAASRLSCP